MSVDHDLLAAFIRAEYAKRPHGCRPAPRALAGALLGRFTLLDGPPTGTRYAMLSSYDGEDRCHVVEDAVDRGAWALQLAARVRELQRQQGRSVNARAVSAPIPPWTPLPLPEDGPR